MERHFEIELEKLKETLLRMGSVVERAVSLAFRSLFELDAPLARLVIEDEKEVNRMQIQIDDAVVRALALHQLMAADLRFALAVSRINAELERIGDQAVNIAEATLRLSQYPKTEPPNVDLPRMSELAASMVRDSLNSFVESDETLAKSVLARDDELDVLRNQAFRALLSYMMSDSSKVFPAFDLILVAKDLERIGDLATNIAEDVIYAVAGRDVRHHAVP
jgi:phosphate transport system protein